MTTGLILGGGRIVGDTAIVWLLLGGAITWQVDQWWEPGNWTETLRGTGSTLTSYVYYSSPVGEGNSEQAAYGAAFVLILLMLVVNTVVVLMARKGAWKR
jgi:phosphate transport system permease protein